MTYDVLDTDHLSILQRRTEPGFSILSEKLSQYSPDLIFVTIISFHEQFQGWMAYLNKSKTSTHIITAYSKIEQLVHLYGISQILSFDEKAVKITEMLKKQRLRIGTLDLRIASIVLANNGVLLTKNTKDFAIVPNLKSEDWCI
ncbi:MAG: type II toxin-antitoxin system VapC family toxin [bacterium]